MKLRMVRLRWGGAGFVASDWKGDESPRLMGSSCGTVNQAREMSL